MFLILVDKNQCEGCGACVNICPMDVFEMIEKKAEPVNAHDCIGCKSCLEVCPTEAIELKEL